MCSDRQHYNTMPPYYTGAAISQFMQISVTSSIVLLNAGNGNRNNFWSRFIAVPHIQATKEEKTDKESCIEISDR